MDHVGPVDDYSFFCQSVNEHLGVSRIIDDNMELGSQDTSAHCFYYARKP